MQHTQATLSQTQGRTLLSYDYHSRKHSRRLRRQRCRLRQQKKGGYTIEYRTAKAKENGRANTAERVRDISTEGIVNARKARYTQKYSPSGRMANGDASGEPNAEPAPANGDRRGEAARSEALRSSGVCEKLRARAGRDTRRSVVRVRLDDELVRGKTCLVPSSVGERPPGSWPLPMSNGESVCGDGVRWALRWAPRRPGSLAASGI